MSESEPQGGGPAAAGQQTWRIVGMDCAACAQTLENGVGKLEGVESCQISFTTETMRVSGRAEASAILDRVRSLGYEVATTEDEAGTPAGAPPPPTPNFLRFLWQRSDTRLALLGALLILPGLLFNELLPMLGYGHPLLNASSVAAMLLAGYPIMRSAARALRINHEININVLMSIAAIGAVIIGAYTEAGLVMVLFAIGEALEGYTAARARDSLRSLAQVMPREAVVLRPCLDCRSHLGQDGYEGGPCPFCGLEEQRVPVADLQVGETIVTRPGERIPMDGRVLAGSSAVNQAPITGESLPLTKQPGDEVFASSINGEGVLHIRVTHLAADNTISRLIQMVEEAQERRAPAQRFVDRFARVYTPAVVLLAALVAIVPPLLLGQPFLNPDAGTQGWLYRALALLVVACPCALVISTPVSIVSAISNAARHGVLVKGGAFLETLSRVRVMAFDKTGTLTRGEPAVVAVKAVDCTDELSGRCDYCDDLLALASAVEQHSEHPLARAVTSASQARGIDRRYPAAEAVTALTGRGVTGRVNETEVFIGSHTYFDQRVAHSDAHCAELNEVAATGQTAMLVQQGTEYRGYIAVADTPRPGSREALAQLRRLGIHHLVMLTGDNLGTAQSVARQMGLSDVHANLLPADKVAAVNDLRRQHGPIAMVGDGINDAPALATADVGIAMGAAGTAQALETADIALLNDDLSRLAFAVRLAQAAMRTIRWNIAFSLGVKGIFLLLVLAGGGSMWLAVLADVGASLLVTLNGTRLLARPRPGK